MTHDDARPWLRIGELSRRVGVSDHVLRAWERRYGLLQPVRSPAGYRLYSAHDERRVRHMTTLLAEGVAAGEAARASLVAVGPGPREPLVPSTRHDPHVELSRAAGERHRGPLAAALEALDEPAAQDALDALFTRYAPEDVLRDVVTPYLHELGERWARGEVTVVQEHFASQVVRGRVTALGRGWGRGPGPRVLLACPPGERHDLGLLMFGVVLSRRDWSVSFLGADTPLAAVAEAAASVRADLVVVSATVPGPLTDVEDQLADLAARVRVHLAGPAGTEDLARRVGATLLHGDPVTAAQTLAV